MMDMDAEKDVVRRFNAEVIGGGDRVAFEQLVSPDFVNRSAPPGSPAGRESLWHTFQNVLRPGLSDLRVVIHDQVAEGARVVTRKTISAVHTGELMGIPATGRQVAIEVIDIVRVEDGRYVEHWGLNTLGSVLAQLKAG